MVVKSLLCCQASRCPKIKKENNNPLPPTKMLSNLKLFLEISFLRRATLRKVAQVTPPPSLKNGEDVKGHSEWSTRLRNQTFTARSIARILHGIASPCYPAEVWGKARQHWRAQLHQDFNLLVRMGAQELLALK